MEENKRQTILTITGSDGTGGAGIQADIKLISALGYHAMSAVTSITAQNTIGIQEFYDLPAAAVGGQIEAIVNDIQPNIVKIGMVRKQDVLEAIAEKLIKYQPDFVIYDTIVQSSKGEILIEDDMLDEIKHTLLPLVSLLVIRHEDAAYLLGYKIENAEDMALAAGQLIGYGCKAVLLQGSSTTPETAIDLYMSGDVEDSHIFSLPDTTQEGERRHGSGSNLSSAIAAFLCNGNHVLEAITHARNYVRQLSEPINSLTGRSRELYDEFMTVVRLQHKSFNDVRFYADRLNVSTRYLAQVTKRIAGQAPKAIIDEYILQESEKQLLASNQTVQEIAYEFGFHSQAHFSKFFKKSTGMTPSQYRKVKQ